MLHALYETKNAMFIFSLIGIILLIGSAASAQGPLADRGNWALGVALPSSSERSFSLWKVHSPVTALGLEIDVSWRYNTNTYDNLDNLNWFSSQFHSLRLQLNPTVKRYRPLHDQVASFVFYQAHANFYFRNHRSDSDSGTQRTTTETDSDLGIALGLGTDWFPFRRISLSAQTGLDLSYRYEEFRSNREWEWSLKTFQTEVAALVYF